MTREPDSARADDVGRRLEHLEEMVSFAERRNDELNAGLLDLAERLRHALDRIARLEARLEGVDEEDEDGQAETPD